MQSSKANMRKPITSGNLKSCPHLRSNRTSVLIARAGFLRTRKVDLREEQSDKGSRTLEEEDAGSAPDVTVGDSEVVSTEAGPVLAWR